MAKLDIYNLSGAVTGSIELSDAIFGIEPNKHAIAAVIRNQLANRRQGTSSTKTRSETRGGGKRPWRQKGTGRARHGSTRSAQYVGGGTIFGPKPRDYSYTLPKKVKRLAMKSLLSLSVQEERLVVVEDFTSENGKTKELAAILKNFVEDGKRTALIMKNDDAMLRRAARNIPYLHVLAYDKLSAKELLYARKVVMLETAAKNLNEFYGE